MDKWDIPPFKFKALPWNEVRSEWIKYKRHFMYVVSATGERDRTRIKNIFLAKAGPDLQEVFSTIPGADVEGSRTVDPFEVAIEKLDNYFAPKQHETFERNVFWTLRTSVGESLEKFMIRCTDQASKCNFGSTVEESRAISVIDKVILFAPSDLKEKLLQVKDLNIDEAAKIISSHESIKQQALAIGQGLSDDSDATSNVNKIQNRPQRRPQPNCTRCGYSGHTSLDENCPARDRQCAKCKRQGHFAVMCLTAPKRKFKIEAGPSKRWKPERIREVRENDDKPPENFIFNIGDQDELIWLRVGGVLLHVLVDSGCKKNIVDERSWKYLKENGVRASNQQTNCEEIFLPYGSQAKPLTTVGKFDATVTIDDEGDTIEEPATFYVIKEGQQCLLGRTTATRLGVLRIGLPSTHGINAVGPKEKHPFPKISGVQVQIPIDESVTPICQHPRRPPIALQSRIEDKIKALLAGDIIEPVEGGCQWVSPLVTVLKDNGDLRLCVDMRRANTAILRERHIMPTIEDFLPRFTTAKYFSRLDIKEAFHQVRNNKKIYKQRRTVYAQRVTPTHINIRWSLKRRADT